MNLLLLTAPLDSSIIIERDWLRIFICLHLYLWTADKDEEETEETVDEEEAVEGDESADGEKDEVGLHLHKVCLPLAINLLIILVV